MIYLVAGTRPNFVKIAPIRRALDARGLAVRMIHTGQHFDAEMSDVFFRDLNLPVPDRVLRCGGGTHAEQTAAVLVGVEADLLEHRPDVVVVVGDVTSTLAAALAAAKLGIPVIHVEAGLRSRDWTMPEEINRVLTDRLADLLLTTSAEATPNLLGEGVEAERIFFAGNVMIDSLHFALERRTDVLLRLGVEQGRYGVVTLHRPANVDTEPALRQTVEVLEILAAKVPIVFPIHPRTLQRLDALGLAARLKAISRLICSEPLGYNDFATLLAGAMFAASDSGGVQEETTALGIPCLTLREGTERPITVSQGTNVIVGLDKSRIATELQNIVEGRAKRGRVPEGWDGRAGERVAQAIERFLEGTPPARTKGPRA